MVIIEKPNDIKLTRPSVTVDIPLNPKPKAPLPGKNGFAIAIVGAPGSGKSSVMFSLIKSKDGYRKRFHKIISVIPESSLNSLKANPLKGLPEEQRFEDLTYENLDDIIEMVVAAALALIIKQLEQSRCSKINCLCVKCDRSPPTDAEREPPAENKP